MNCPCGTQKVYEDCCNVAHKSLANVVTAEQLMRSRYTAFTMAKGDYLMLSYHSSTRPIKEKKAIVAWAKSVTWLNLEIIQTTLGLEKDAEGTVEFKAYFMENGVMNHIHENSKFVKENNCWVYLGFAN